MMKENIYCLSVTRPDDAFFTPLSASIASSYAEYILNNSRTWATVGVERSDEEREGAFQKD